METDRKVDILLVDDEPRNITALEALLAAPDRNLVTALSGEQALRRLLDSDFAVILLDVRMPGLDGFETAELIRKRDRSRDTPIIFLTADNTSAGMAHRGYEIGAVDYILKPLDPDVMRSKVAVFVELHRRTEETRVQARQLAELNVKLAHRSQLLEGKLEMLAGLGDALNGMVQEDALLDELLRRCLHASGVDRGAAFLLDRRKKLVLRARVGYTGAADRAVRGFFGQTALLADAVRTGETIAVPGPGVSASDADRLLARAGARSLLIAPLALLGEPLGALVLASLTTALVDEQETFARVVSGHASQAVVLARTLAERADLLARERTAHAAAEAARRRMAFLAEVSSELASSLDVDPPLQQIAERAVPEAADACLIDLMAEDGPITCAAAAFADPRPVGTGTALVGQPRDRLASPRTMRALHVGDTLVFETVHADDLAEIAGGGDRQGILTVLGVRTAIVAPLLARGRTLGAITLVRTTVDRPYDAEDVAFAEDLARRVAMAVDNSRLREETRAAVRMRDEFLAGASHDLKTPITAISGQAQILRLRAKRAETLESEHVAEGARRILVATTKMQSLVEELLDVARTQPGGSLELDRRPTDLVALVHQVVSEIPRGSVAHDIVVEAAEPELIGDWDPTRIERVLSNLISNALKYSPAGGRIGVTLARDSNGAEAVLRVEDSGIGIPADELSRIFDRFYRGRNVIGKIVGTGIGLAGVRSIVEQHGGRVAVDSQEGVGTTITVHLPIAAATADGPTRDTALALSA